MAAIDYGCSISKTYSSGNGLSLTTAPRGRLICIFVCRQLLDGIQDRCTHKETPSPGDPVSECTTKDVNGEKAKDAGKTDPPRRGPTTLAKEKTAPKVPKRRGRCSSLVAYEMTVRIAVMMPLAPIPATARPKIYKYIPLISSVGGDDTSTYKNVHAWCHTAN